MKRFTLKRITALVLALIMTLSMCPVTVLATDTIITISEENFPDANFRNYVADNFDANDDGVLSAVEREAVSTIYCTRRNIGSLTGIEYFPELKTLTCYDNQLGELDVSKNPALESLDFRHNQLSSIDVSKNSELKTLHCTENLLTTIDISNNPLLETLSCEDNRLTALDVSNNPKLKSLYCSFNQLATIDVSKNPAIEQLSCFDNQLTSLDLSKNTALTSLFCYNNQLEMLDVSKNTALTSLSCYNNQLEMLDVSKNPQLISLDCFGNCLSNLDLSKNPALESLDFRYNQLSSIDVSKNPQLISLHCFGNCLSNLDVSNNPMLTYLYCSSNQITELNVSNNLHLKEFDCTGNQLDSLDVSKNSALESLYCKSNQLTNLDVSQNEVLTTLWCDWNQLNALDVSKNTALKDLRCSGNQLATLDTSNNLLLEILGCDFNQLTTIDVSKNVALTRLYCCYNQLTSLDLSANTALSHLEGNDNSFSVVLDENKRFDLSTLPGSFDVSKASNWTNGMVSGTILTVTDTNSPVTYDYDCGNNITLSFSLVSDTVTTGGDIAISEENFPDANFRSYVADNFDANGDGMLSVAEREAVFTIDCDRCNITSLDGIEYFPVLSTLFCDGNQLTSIDVSKNPLLFRFECEGNQLASIDVSNNTALYMFYCGRNQLTSIDLSKNTALEYLSCRSNPLTTLDLSNNSLLKDLNCVECPLTTLDVSHNPELEDLMFGYNQMTSVDVSKNPALKFLSFQDTKLTSIDVSKNLLLEELNCVDNQLTSLDVSKNLSLTRLWCYGNQLSAIDVSKNSALKSLHCGTNQIKSLDVSSNSALEELYCDNNQLTTIDVSKNPLLEFLNCERNQLTALDIKNNPAISSLGCASNQLTSLDLSANTALSYLSCDNNQLTTIDIGNCPALGWFWCNGNQLASIDISRNFKLKSLHCGTNQIKSLNVSKNSALEELYCDNNQLTTIDVSKNPLLEFLNCKSNQLTALDIKNNPAISSLRCASNQLTSLDLSANTALSYLSCECNQLTALDISGNTKLETLHCNINQLTTISTCNNVALKTLSCYSNRLTNIDVSNNSKLEWLDCGSNQLTNIDVSNNSKLEWLNCGSNQLTSIDVSNSLELEGLVCSINKLKSLDVSNNSKLEWLNCGNNQLTSIDVSNNPALETFGCQYNRLTSLDVSNNSKLDWLNCGSNQLTSIDVSNNSALEEFACPYNRLTSLDVSANTALFFFEGDYHRFSVVLDENKQFDLSTLPGSFDVSKASNWTNGMVSGTILTVTDTSLPVTYDYDCGNDHTVCFTIQAENVWYGLAGPDGGMPETWIRGTLTEAMNYSNGLISGTAYIQLCSDVDTFAPLEFASEKNTILDLNGYDIDRGLTQAVDDGNVITVEGNLTLCDTSENAATAPGKITGGYGYYDVGGVWVKDGGTLNITGGAIADNRSEKGTGGVIVYGGGTVNMSGGVICGNKGWQTGGVFLSGGGIMTDNGFEEICGILNMSGGSIIGNERNTDNEYGAGGISVIGEKSLFLSGSASITGNVKHCGYPSNIWLKGNSVIITGELSGAFGIGKEYEEFDHPSSYLVAEGTDDYAITAEDRAKFTSDNGHNVLLNSEGNQLMLAPGAYAVSFNLQGIEGSVDSQTILYGEKALSPDSPTSEDYAFLGWYKEPACENIWNFDTDIVTKTTVLYAKWGEKTDKDGLWCEDIAPQIYTGSAIKPMVRVYFRDKLLAEKIDYTLSYKNNTNAADCDSTKAPTITIKGKGNFSGTLTKTFTILPADIGSNLPIEEIYAAANGRGQKPKITITIGTKKLGTKDMTVTYYNAEEGFWMPGDGVESCVGEGTWAIVASGQGNYTGERTYLFHAVGADKLISKAKLSLSAKSITYDGNWHTPEVKVMIGKTELTEGEHYSVSYRDNHGVGTATVTVTGINGYVGTATTTFKITGIPMSKIKVEFLNKATGEYSTKAPSYTYTGEPIKMYEDMGDFRVYYDAKVDGETTRINLSPLEYSVSYQNNDRKGTATMLLTGKEAWGFTGTLKKTFKIDAYDILKDIENSIEVEENIVVSYMKGGAKPVPVITFNGKELVAGVDYTLAYKNNTAVADADSAKAPMITISGKGNFVGKVSQPFSIVPREISEVTLSVEDKVYSTKATGLSTVSLVDADGKKLSAGKDYDKAIEYTYAENVTLMNGFIRKAGDAVQKTDIIPARTTINISVKGMGNYEGEITESYRVVPASLAKATVKVANQQYTGKPIVPDKDDITVTVNKVKVDPENFEIVSCTNNVNKGSATLTIRGVGENYGGIKTVKFKIDAKTMFWSNLQSTLFDLFT